MGIVVLIFIGIIIAVVVRGCKSDSYSTPVHNRFYFDDYDDYLDAERDNRSYFSDDLSDDYSSYYMQTYDDALMGDRDAIDELREEFGEDWGEEF